MLEILTWIAAGYFSFLAVQVALFLLMTCVIGVLYSLAFLFGWWSR